MVEKSNTECIRQFTHSQHLLVDRDEVVKEIFIIMDTLKKLVTAKRYLKFCGERNNKKLQLINEIENVLHKSVTSYRVTVQPSVTPYRVTVQPSVTPYRVTVQPSVTSY